MPEIRPPPLTGTRVVERMHEGAAALGGQAAGGLLALGRGHPHDLGAERLRRGDLVRRRPLRDRDECRDAEPGRRVRHRMCVVAAGDRDHAAFALLGAQARQGVDRPADLEGAGRLEALGLDPQRPVRIGPRARQQGGAHRDAGDPLGGRGHVRVAHQFRRSVGHPAHSSLALCGMSNMLKVQNAPNCTRVL
jgi:hypothetical protein